MVKRRTGKEEGMIPVTVWLRYAKDKLAWEHNHYEDGHVNLSQNKPLGHDSWVKYQWRKCFMFLENGVIL